MFDAESFFVGMLTGMILMGMFGGMVAGYFIRRRKNPYAPKAY